jgi:hypothetical protein
VHQTQNILNEIATVSIRKMSVEIRSPKSEYRNANRLILNSNYRFPSDFELRSSDFNPLRSLNTKTILPAT